MSSGQNVANIPSAFQLHATQLCEWTAGAAHAIFVYDLVLTSAEEYQYVWQARWSLGKTLYILVRYPYNLITLAISVYIAAVPNSFTIEFCKGLNYWATIGGLLQLVVVQVVMSLRTAALYNLQTGVIIFVVISGILSSGSILAVDVQYLLRVVYIKPSEEPALATCIQFCPDCHPFSRLVFLPMISFDAAVFFLTLYKHHIHAKREVYSKGTLLQVLYRDGFVSFAIIFAMMLVNFIIFITAPPPLMLVMGPLLRSILGITCGRLLLNLRGAILRRSYSENTTLLSTLAFERSLDSWADGPIGGRTEDFVHSSNTKSAEVTFEDDSRVSLGFTGRNRTNAANNAWEMQNLKPSS